MYAKGRHRAAKRKATQVLTKAAVNRPTVDKDQQEQFQKEEERGSRAKMEKSVHVDALHMIADDYIPGITPGVWKRVQNVLTNVFSWYKLKKDLPNETKPIFKETVASIYREYQIAFADGDQDMLRQLVVPHCFGSVKSKMKRLHSQLPANQKMEWKGIGDPKVKIVTIRAVPVDELALNFTQITVNIACKQQIIIKNTKDDAVIKETDPTLIQEYWTMERCTNATRSINTWRYAGTLPLLTSKKN